MNKTNFKVLSKTQQAAIRGGNQQVCSGSQAGVGYTVSRVDGRNVLSVNGHETEISDREAHDLCTQVIQEVPGNSHIS